MPLSRNAPLRKGASENKKRKRIRKYFKFKKKWSWVLFIIAIVTLPIGIGFILLIVWFLWWLFVLRDIPGDRTIDAWLADDIEQLKKRALQRADFIIAFTVTIAPNP